MSFPKPEQTQHILSKYEVESIVRICCKLNRGSRYSLTNRLNSIKVKMKKR